MLKNTSIRSKSRILPNKILIVLWKITLGKFYSNNRLFSLKNRTKNWGWSKAQEKRAYEQNFSGISQKFLRITFRLSKDEVKTGQPKRKQGGFFDGPYAAYCVSKAADIAYSKYLARTLKSKNIQVNGVSLTAFG